MDKNHSVDITLAERLFDHAEIEGKIVDIPKIQRVSGADNPGAAAALGFFEKVSPQGWKVETVPGTSVSGDHGMAAGTGDHGEILAFELRQAETLHRAYGFDYGTNPHNAAFTTDGIHDLIIGGQGRRV
jgi:hypothetical protein